VIDVRALFMRERSLTL